jgi:transposase InsO family protein
LDNGGEYISNEFKDFFKDERINRELIVSYNPQQNGVVKRKNQSIINSARDMIHDQEFLMIIWEEICNMELYVYNRSPHMILGKNIWEDSFSGVKPEIGHLRIFICLGYIHVLVEKRTNMDPLA